MTDATLKEIRELARQAGVEWIATYGPLIEQFKLNLLDDAVLEELSKQDRNYMQRCMTGFREAGGLTPKESRAFFRGLRDGMKQGYADLFKPYLVEMNQ